MAPASPVCQVPGLVILPVDASFHFGNVEFLQEAAAQAGLQAPMRDLVIEASSVDDLDRTSVDSLVEMVCKLQDRGFSFFMTSVEGPPWD